MRPLDRILEIIVGVLLLIIFPIFYFSLKQDAVIRTKVETDTTTFVDDIRSKGYMTRGMYEDYLQQLSETGLIYNVEFEHKQAILEPEYRFRTAEEVIAGQNGSYNGTNVYHNFAIATDIPTVTDANNNGLVMNTDTNESILAAAVHTPASSSHIHTDDCYLGHHHTNNYEFYAPHVHSDDCYITCTGLDYDGNGVIDNHDAEAVPFSNGNDFGGEWGTAYYCKKCHALIRKVGTSNYMGRETPFDYTYNHGLDRTNPVCGKKAGDLTDRRRVNCFATTDVITTVEYNTFQPVLTYMPNTESISIYTSTQGVFYIRYDQYSSDLIYPSTYNVDNITINYSLVGEGRETNTIYTSIPKFFLSDIPQEGYTETIIYSEFNPQPVRKWYKRNPDYDTYLSLFLRWKDKALSSISAVNSVWQSAPAANGTGGTRYYYGVNLKDIYLDYELIKYPLGVPRTAGTYGCNLDGDTDAKCDEIVVSITPTHPVQTVYVDEPIIRTAVATYLDGSTGIILCNTSFISSIPVSNQTVSLSYINARNKTLTCTEKITVIPKSKTCNNGHTYNLNNDGSDPGCPYCRAWLRSLSIDNPSSGKISIYRGTTLAENGVVLLAIYLDGHKEYVDKDYIDNLDKTYIGNEDVTISYKGKYVHLTITVKRNIVQCPVCHRFYELYPDDTDPGCPYCAAKTPIFTGKVMSYYDVKYTDELMEELYDGSGIYRFHNNDYFKITTKNCSRSLGEGICMAFYRNLNSQSIYATYGGYIRENGDKNRYQINHKN